MDARKDPAAAGIASMALSRPLAWIRGRRATAHRYEIRSGRRSDARDIRLLERAFARVGVDGRERVTGVEVSGASGCLVVAMDVIGPPGDAEGECERLFAVAWYDAFGVRGSGHLGRLGGAGLPLTSGPAAGATARLYARAAEGEGPGNALP